VRPIHVWVSVILLGAVLSFSACQKGPAGPAGLAGTPPPVTAPFCASPAVYGVQTPGVNFGDGSGWLYATPVTLASAQTAVSISVNVASGAVSGQVRMGIYNDNGHVPHNLAAETDPRNIAVGWNSAPVSPPVYLPAGTYWMVFMYSNSTNGSFTSGVGEEYSLGYVWGELPKTFPTGSTYVYRNDIQIRVCP
jgi:hypothetical protein